MESFRIQKKNNRLTLRVSSVLSHLYFFFNSVALPFGLLYTHLLSPLFYLWTLKNKRRPLLKPLLFFLIPYDLIHLVLGVDLKSFAISNLLLISTYIFVISFIWFVQHYEHIHRLLARLLMSNFILTCISIIVFFTPYRESMWYVNKFTNGVENFPRLAMFTYEASYYSLLLTPLVFYFLLRVFFNHQQKSKGVILFLVLFPLALSLSVGVLSAMAISFIVLYILHWKEVLQKRGFFMPLVSAFTFSMVGFLILLIFFPDNPIFIRIGNILTGVDSSANGRTTDSFGLAWKIAGLKSYLFGCGLGQIKMLGPEIARIYYNHWGEIPVVRIPNAMGETLAIFGITGVLLRFALIFWFFLKTKVWTNNFRTLAFTFVFIYQFTGSFIINIVEYTIWVLAFVNCFPEFDTKMKQIESKE